MRPIVRWCLYNRPVVVLLSLIFLVGAVFGLGRINQEQMSRQSETLQHLYALVVGPVVARPAGNR